VTYGLYKKLTKTTHYFMCKTGRKHGEINANTSLTKKCSIEEMTGECDLKRGQWEGFKLVSESANRNAS
jgi:hypothetical protein